MKINLRVWRQCNSKDQGRLVEYTLDGVSGDMSFLEMLDMLNENLTAQGEEPVAFDSDCREGICGQCGVVINGVPHGGMGVAQPVRTTTCQLHMRSFADGSTITIEPWKSGAFPILRDLIVDRSALDRVIQAGGYVSPLPASVVAPAWRPARTALQCCSPRRRSLTWPCSRRVSRSGCAASRRWLLRTTLRDLVAAPTSVSVPRCARRAFRWSPSVSLTATLSPRCLSTTARTTESCLTLSTTRAPTPYGAGARSCCAALGNCGPGMDFVSGAWVWKNVAVLSVSGSCHRGTVWGSGNGIF